MRKASTMTTDAIELARTVLVADITPDETAHTLARPLLAMAAERDELLQRRDALLAMVARISQEAPLPDEVDNALKRAKREGLVRFSSLAREWWCPPASPPKRVVWEPAIPPPQAKQGGKPEKQGTSKRSK